MSHRTPVEHPHFLLLLLTHDQVAAILFSSLEEFELISHSVLKDFCLILGFKLMFNPSFLWF